MEVRPALVVTPADLGSHPLFPATQYVQGAMVLIGVSASDFLADTETQQLFKEAIASATNVADQTVHDVEILGVSNVSTISRRLLSSISLSVDFRITTRTYASSTAIMSTVAEVLSKPLSFMALRNCSAGERMAHAICSSSVEVREPLSRKFQPEALKNLQAGRLSFQQEAN